MNNEIGYRLVAAFFSYRRFVAMLTFCRSFVCCVCVKEIVRSFGALRQTISEIASDDAPN